MKLAKEREAFRKMSVKELEKKADEVKKDLFGLRLNSVTAHIKDYSQFRKLKRKVARILTYLQQKRSLQRGKL